MNVLTTLCPPFFCLPTARIIAPPSSFTSQFVGAMSEIDSTRTILLLLLCLGLLLPVVILFAAGDGDTAVLNSGKTAIGDVLNVFVCLLALQQKKEQNSGKRLGNALRISEFIGGNK